MAKATKPAAGVVAPTAKPKKGEAKNAKKAVNPAALAKRAQREAARATSGQQKREDGTDCHSRRKARRADQRARAAATGHSAMADVALGYAQACARVALGIKQRASDKDAPSMADRLRRQEAEQAAHEAGLAKRAAARKEREASDASAIQAALLTKAKAALSRGVVANAPAA